MTKVRMGWAQYTFTHYRLVTVADTTHTGGERGLHEIAMPCEANYPAAHCPCGEYELQWWL